MVPVNQSIHIVDREDQVSWYVDPESISFCLDLKDKKREVREWLEQMTSDTVVISGQGKMPRCGTNDHPTNMFSSIQRHQFRVYFADEQDAMLFKLTWGGSS